LCLHATPNLEKTLIVNRSLTTFAALALIGACGDLVPSAPVSARAPLSSNEALRASGASLRAGYYIVVLKSRESDPGRLGRDMIATHGGRLEFTYTSALHGFAAALPPAAVAALRSRADVAFVEPDEVMTIDATQLYPTWGLDRIDQASLPLDSKYTYNATGAGVNVYIMDTGIRASHSEFGGRASGAYTAIADGNGTNDCHGHGTHVAGTVGGATYGVAKGVKLRAVRVMDCLGSGATSTVIAGIDWVTANHVKPAVVNMSLSGPGSSALDAAVQSSIASGVTYTAAAGNSNVDACTRSPARLPAVLTAGATSSSDARAIFSNWGTCVDLFAPGDGITSASHSGDTQTARMSGTSMAAPHVAGAAALYLQGNAGASPATVASALSGNATTNKVSNAGSGSPNRLLNVAFIGGTTSTPTTPTAPTTNASPVARFTASCSGLTCTFDARASTDDVGVVSYAWDLNKYPGNTASGSVVTATYPHEGTRYVTLTVTDGGGLTSKVTQTINIGATPTNQPPVAQFSVSCSNLSCSFDSGASTDDAGITSRSWTFGDGTSAGNSVSTSHSYGQGGTYNVKLTVTDGAGLSSSITKAVSVTAAPAPVVDAPPAARFTWSCAGSVCTLDASTSSDDVGIAGYSWNLGKWPDGTATGVKVTTDYWHSGPRYVTLTVTDTKGQKSSVQQTVNVP
jgi:subtilisin family serine protease